MFSGAEFSNNWDWSAKKNLQAPWQFIAVSEGLHIIHYGL